ncbi:MAG: putative terminase small subunit [Caudoviricetes sp.]|nr:MAG: putative terminase small subunit [Caudoviricetes sp.]
MTTQETVITAQDLLLELEEARQAALHGNLDLDAMPEAIRKDKKMMAIAALNKMKHVPQASAAVAATMAKARILGLDKVIIKATVNFSDELAGLMDEVANEATGGGDGIDG